uniref:Uncharacterized protein n=1 Tax=Aegilops tauschii subsp. strangulata TaxID=200361 RepID=A0A453JUI3_AEGTS
MLIDADALLLSNFQNVCSSSRMLTESGTSENFRKGPEVMLPPPIRIRHCIEAASFNSDQREYMISFQ